MVVAVHLFTHFHILFIFHRCEYKKFLFFSAIRTPVYWVVRSRTQGSPLGDVHVSLCDLVPEMLSDFIGLD